MDYDARYLEAIPDEFIERDYGCGDPSRYLRKEETVLDLGSGTGKVCFIATQVVGPKDRVIGVDMTDEILELARGNAPLVAENIDHANVESRKGRIQDLALDFDLLDTELKSARLCELEGFLEAESIADKLRKEAPMIASGNIDAVVSNCALNLVACDLKPQLFGELFRVLKPDGRAVISDIVSSDDVPENLQRDAELWSGCISGALREDLFLRAFADAGFDPVRILKRDESPWREVGEITFRSLTVEAIKPNASNTRSPSHLFMPSVSGSHSPSCC